MMKFVLFVVALFSVFSIALGAGGKLVGLEHGVGGTLTATPGKLSVQNFKYDGQAPSAYWWAAPSCNYIDIVKNGYRISDSKVSQAYSGKTYSTSLNKDVSKAGCILLYCEDFKADLGHVALKKKGL